MEDDSQPTIYNIDSISFRSIATELKDLEQSIYIENNQSIYIENNHEAFFGQFCLSIDHVYTCSTVYSKLYLVIQPQTPAQTCCSTCATGNALNSIHVLEYKFV